MRATRELEFDRCDRTELESNASGRGAAFWNWAFEPVGTGVHALCTRGRDGAPAALLAALRVPVLIEAQPAELLQVIEAKIAGPTAMGLRNPGRFVHLAEHFARTHGGMPPEAAPILYGLPTPSLWRIAKQHLSAKVMRTQDVLRSPVKDLKLPAVGAVEVEAVSEFPDSVAQLKLRAAESSQIVARPTAAALNHRFAAFPDRNFRIAVARRGGELVGYAVFGVGSFDREQELGLVWDWCVPGDDGTVGIALLHWLCECARETDCEELCILLPDTLPEWVTLQIAGFRVRSSNYFIAVRHFARKMTMRWLYHNWSYSLGDLLF